MGTLGEYLREARKARGIDLREAAQQTRISLQYLQALEEENFAKLPGEVFVKGFLKSYSKFLRVDETQVMQRYAELRGKKAAAPPPAAGAPAAPAKPAPAEPEETPPPPAKTPIEPFVWGAGIVAILIAFLFVALPSRHKQKPAETPGPVTAPTTTIASALTTTPTTTAVRTDKLYLEVTALENTWLLVRTDVSPQKKATLVKGDSLTWSANERFILSYGSAGALKLALNGRELVVGEPKSAVVRDLEIIASGLVNKKLKVEPSRAAKPKPKTAPTGTGQPLEQRKPVATKPTQTAVAPAPQQLQSQSAPVSQEQRTAPQPIAPLGQH